MNHLVAIVFDIEVWNGERRDRRQRQRQRLVDLRSPVLIPQRSPHLPQGAQHLRPIVPLSLTVLAEVRHRLSTSSLIVVPYTVRW